VQGVGFRPCVYRYAVENELTGFIINSTKGVTIEVQGSQNQIDNFTTQLKNNPPETSVVYTFNLDYISSIDSEKSFEILFSEESGREKTAGISPDLATCENCIDDIFDIKNHRYNYPFTNCTNCGPRFTIIMDRPYDRQFTSMKEFTMCERCSGEYSDPGDRRFHAQPNACIACGPELKLIYTDKTLLSYPDSIYDRKNCSQTATNTKSLNPQQAPEYSGSPEKIIYAGIDYIDKTSELLKKGKIAAIKGLGGFHFACDPFNSKTLKRIREVKNRPNKAFSIMMSSIKEIKKYCSVSEYEEEALLSSAAPIVLLRKKNNRLEHVSPDNNYLGVMLPFTPLHHLLMDKIPILIMTSANRRDEPIAISDREAEAFLEINIIDFIVTHNRSIVHRCDDSIVHFLGKMKLYIRRSRGYVPNPILVTSVPQQSSISLGGNLKNTFALRRGKKIFLSQHIGDLGDYRNFQYQNSQINDFSRLLEINAEEVRCDAHPGYENYSAHGQHIYHHHAHMLSVMAEHDLKGPSVLGIICDGTGYGTDKSIWGFEFLKNSDNNRSFERMAHLEYFILPGGDRATREIDRIAIALSPEGKALPFSPNRITAIRDLINSGINCPRTSSLGRLFDGIAALTSLTDTVEYEARGAILVQKEAEKIVMTPSERYPAKISTEKSLIEINYDDLIYGVLSDLENKVEISIIAWKFHKWISDSIISVLELLQFDKIVLSGGCFQNLLLCRMVIESLESHKYEYYLNEMVPPNDGGISLGQAFF